MSFLRRGPELCPKRIFLSSFRATPPREDGSSAPLRCPPNARGRCVSCCPAPLVAWRAETGSRDARGRDKILMRG